MMNTKKGTFYMFSNGTAGTIMSLAVYRVMVKTGVSQRVAELALFVNISNERLTVFDLRCFLRETA